MQQTMGADQTAEWIRAAQYGDPWACDQLLRAHQPLVGALASRALVARPAVAVETVVGETLRRAHGSLHTLPHPDAFRSWLVALAVDTTLGHAAASLDQAAGWLDVQDAMLAALGSLEDEGQLLRHETSAALGWTPEETATRMATVRVRVDAARSVASALARRPRCPRLQELTAGWDGRPGAGWRDHLAAHTSRCAGCGGVAPAAPAAQAWPVAGFGGAAPTVGAAFTAPEGGAGYGPEAAAGYATGAGFGYGPEAAFGAEAGFASEAAFDAEAEYDLQAEAEGGLGGDDVTRAYDLGGLAAAPAGRRGSRAALRRRRQAQEKTRRRAAVAAGIAVVAVTGGAFSFYGGRDGQREILEANRALVPAPDVPLTHEPDSLGATPATTGAAPSATATTAPRPTATTATPGTAGKKTPTARPTTASPTPQRTTASPTATPAKKPSAPKPTRTAPKPTADTDPGGGAQNDSGQTSAADQVLSLVNAERAKAGCGPLTANAALARAAQGHSDDMAARDFFDHTNPDGAGPGERVTAAGYPWATYGENIAMGQTTAEQVMEGWMNSPGHRANILNCDFKEIGVGVQTDGGPYWTQVFGAR
ncbi:hypothetical protein GCM10010363_44920 [Streptomyces omiyaensis]|uniref:CAP domain-containing protein n=1 Tax=Streptomyces omiyaensis TaxID=68247 RepID=UPI0016796487|nr:CAP domain-containing protein [Streptomyces omiyaensis]GGY58484.1 hypothetical protein GCM10010363_44920 [Streptomyces omiyaensis]